VGQNERDHPPRTFARESVRDSRLAREGDLREALHLPDPEGERGDSEPHAAQSRRVGHLRLRDLPQKRLRAVLHQLYQREAATGVYRADAQSGAGRVQHGGHPGKFQLSP
jgi:hypothetical protein